MQDNSEKPSKEELKEIFAEYEQRTARNKKIILLIGDIVSGLLGGLIGGGIFYLILLFTGF